jgi:excisionase family DNA binding protein
MTLPEAARYLRVSTKTIKDLVASGSLPARPVEGGWRLSKSAIHQWLDYRNGKAALLSQVGAFADDDTLMPMLDKIYAERRRNKVGAGVK